MEIWVRKETSSGSWFEIFTGRWFHHLNWACTPRMKSHEKTDINNYSPPGKLLGIEPYMRNMEIG